MRDFTAQDRKIIESIKSRDSEGPRGACHIRRNGSQTCVEDVTAKGCADIGKRLDAEVRWVEGGTCP